MERLLGNVGFRRIIKDYSERQRQVQEDDEINELKENEAVHVFQSMEWLEQEEKFEVWHCKTRTPVAFPLNNLINLILHLCLKGYYTSFLSKSTHFLYGLDAWTVKRIRRP